MATNKLTEIREAVEALFVDQLDTLIKEYLRFNSEAAVNFDDPALTLASFLRVDPLGGPCDTNYTTGAVRLTRKFRIFFNIGVGNMDAEQLEAIDAAVMGCLFTGAANQLGLSYVQQVRCLGGDYAMFVKDKSGKKDAVEEEMWVGLSTVEVDARFTKAEIIAWKPT